MTSRDLGIKVDRDVPILHNRGLAATRKSQPVLLLVSTDYRSIITGWNAREVRFVAQQIGICLSRAATRDVDSVM